MLLEDKIYLYIKWIIIFFLISFINNPLVLGIFIMLLVLLIANCLRNLMFHWYRLILILIYIGGLIVIFAYFLAISPNKKLRNIKSLIFIFLWILINYNSDIICSSGNSLINISLDIYRIILLGLILFIILIGADKITNRNEGSFRPF